MSWQITNRISASLSDARLQLHWAAQAATGIGRTLIPPRADDSHTSFMWSAPHGALLQECVDGVSAGVRLADLTAMVIRDGRVEKALALEGLTLDEAFAFFESVYGAMLKRPDVDLPDHPVAHGARFSASPDDLAELARHYANAAMICADAFDCDLPVRCWPHHFDIAVLMALPEEKSIGVGMSPGDGSYDEPYFYVNAWPYPTAPLTPLSHGHWHTKGWTGGVLTASALAAAEDQEGLARSFVAEAVEALRRAIDNPAGNEG